MFDVLTIVSTVLYYFQTKHIYVFTYLHFTVKSKKKVYMQTLISELSIKLGTKIAPFLKHKERVEGFASW